MKSLVKVTDLYSSMDRLETYLAMLIDEVHLNLYSSMDRLETSTFLRIPSPQF